MRIINWILLFPLVLIAISFAVSNRQIAELTLWPFPFSIEMPLVLFGFFMMLIGFFAGGFASWVAGKQKRKDARDSRKRASVLDKEVLNLKTALDAEKKASVESDVVNLPPASQSSKNEILPSDSKWSASR